MKQESTQATSVNALNRAKMYQLVLFPMNNGATNVYYILTMNFIAYYANGVLGLLLAFATTMVTLMRAWGDKCLLYFDNELYCILCKRSSWLIAGICNYNGNIDACRRCVH